jgi:hypothetical protein
MKRWFGNTIGKQESAANVFSKTNVPKAASELTNELWNYFTGAVIANQKRNNMDCKIEADRMFCSWPTRHVRLTCSLPKSGNFKQFVEDVNDIWRQIPEGSRVQDLDFPYFSWPNHDCFSVEWTRAATEEENRISANDRKDFLEKQMKREKEDIRDYVKRNLKEVKKALQEIES